MEPPSYSISIPNTSKDGDVIFFSLETKKKVSDDLQQVKVVLRQYEDFEYLCYCLSIKHDMTPIVMPPLPPKPVAAPGVDPKDKGNGTQPIYEDENLLDCKKLQRFLEDAANHSCFKDDETLEQFLMDDEPIARTSTRKGVLKSLVNMLDSKRYMNVKDVDEEYQDRRDGINAMLFNTRRTNNVKDTLLNSIGNYATQYGNLAMVCRDSFINLDDSEPKLLSRYLGQFSEMLDEYQSSNRSVYKILNESIGLNLEEDSRYLLSCQEMLFGRTCRMVQLDNATKALEKAKPKNKEQLEIAKEDAEKEFERVSAQARVEYDDFSRRRALRYKDSLFEYAQRRVRHHKDVCEFLNKGINELKSLH